MTFAESVRQYQAALEADRLVRTEFAGSVSALDVLDAAAAELEAARGAMVDLWRLWARGRLDASG